MEPQLGINMKKAVWFLMMLLILVSCSARDADVTDENVVASSKQENNDTDSVEQKDVFNQFSVLIAVKAIRIRSNPSTENEENIIGLACMGETYTVYEQVKDDKYTWYRIGVEEWIASDGTWCIEYGNGKEGYPHVLNDEEKLGLISRLDTGTRCLNAYYDGNDFLFNVLKDDKEYEGLLCGCDIVFSICRSEKQTPYKYGIGNVVQMESNVFDVYVIPISFGGYEDLSTGCFRISDIGTYTGDGVINDQRLCLDLTLFQNNNAASNVDLDRLYGVELNYRITGVAY